MVLDSPTTVAASIAQVRQVAAAVGEGARGEGVVAEIEAALRSSPGRGGGPRGEAGRWRGLAATDAGAARPPHHALHGPPPRPGGDLPRALFYISGDLANGSGNLLDELMRTAGLRNAAAEYGLAYTGIVPVETLVARPPEVVIATGAGRSQLLRQRLLPSVRQVSFPRTLLNCGGPSIPPALARLRAIRAAS